MNTVLINYFEGYATKALEMVKNALLTKGYYERVLRQLQNKEDLSDQLPIIKKVGVNATNKVVKEALADCEKDLLAAWKLSSGIAENAKSTLSQIVNEREMLPRYEVLHQFKTEAGTVKVTITTMGENIKLDITAGNNKMASQAAMYELEKQIAFINLTQ